MKTYSIQVRQGLPDGNYVVVETIQRKLWGEQIGNFNPVFCRYHGAKTPQRVLVQSDAGDLSDPFRREESYSQTFYIELPEMTQAEFIALRSAGLLPFNLL